MLAAACALACAPLCVAQDDMADGYVARDEQLADFVELLDDRVPAIERRPLALALSAAAVQQDRTACWLSGSLQRRGDELAGNPFPRDPEGAQSDLFCAASQGNSFAMAQLAELDLELGAYLEAMAWAQMYAKFELAVGLATAGTVEDGYAAELIERIDAKLDADGRTKAEARVAELQKRYGNDIAASAMAAAQGRMLAADGKADGELAYAVGTYRPYRVRHPGRRSGIAVFVIEVAPDGRLARHVLVDALPRRQTVTTAERVVEDLRFTPTGSDEPRYAIVPILVDVRTRSLKRPAPR
jgi:hypothetical protein